MRAIVFVLVFAIGGLASADPSSDPTEVKGHWTWKGPGDAVRHFSPETACKAWIKVDFTLTHTDRSYVGVKPPGDPVTSNDYSCRWIDKSDKKKKVQESTNVLAASYICPAETLAHTLANSGKVADWSCRCDAGKICLEGPPAPDTTARCQPQDGKKVTKAEADAASAKNQTDVAKHADPDLLAEYKYLQTNEAVVNECEFKKSDLCDAGANDINIGQLCGFRAGDEAAANNLAGYGKQTPTTSAGEACTWHHHQDLGRMQLVKMSVHSKCSHEGGVSIWKQALGIKEYPTNLAR